jgi:hypothetical protein
MITVLVGTVAVVSVAGVGLWSRRRAKKVQGLEPGRIVIATNLATSRRR